MVALGPLGMGSPCLGGGPCGGLEGALGGEDGPPFPGLGPAWPGLRH